MASSFHQAKLTEIRRKSFRDQAIFFLNSSEAGDDRCSCKLVRSLEQKCAEHQPVGEESVVDEFTAHRLLEFSNKPCTSSELRQFMDQVSGKESGARRISLAELLIYQFDEDWKKIVSKPDCRDILAEKDARDKLEMANAALNKLTEAATEAAKAAEDAHQFEEKALRQELCASKAAESAQAAKIAMDESKEKVGSTLVALNIQEESARAKQEKLESIASDETNGIVLRNRMKAELAILLNEDPIKLRSARIQQGTAMKKMTAAAKKAEETVLASETALQLATHTRKEAIRLKQSALVATKNAETAIPPAQTAFNKISETLDEIMRKEKTGKGSIFFIQSDLNTSRKKLPNSRFVVAQKRASDIVELAAPLSRVTI